MSMKKRKLKRKPRDVHIKQGKLIGFRAKPCPDCGKVLDGFTGMSETPRPLPNDGDITICVYCRRLLEFCSDGYRFAASSRLDEFPPEYRTALETLIKLSTGLDIKTRVLLDSLNIIEPGEPDSLNIYLREKYAIKNQDDIDTIENIINRLKG